ncbi:hypothetical protein AXF42_Ash007214 [Apostasia shenzhenica]|uniref:Uncharacterized protein n=1 Tax=Apostasia shenzhenica TaxID=1088818 RepID=A0A2I0B9L5_9ASPA|nr:hypothetical protein AXF42_Ash007214 [Apostasia shenzhenica]
MSDLGQASDTRVQPSLVHDAPGPSLAISSSTLRSGACHNQAWSDRAVPRTRRFSQTHKSRIHLPLCASPSPGTLSLFLVFLGIPYILRQHLLVLSLRPW